MGLPLTREMFSLRVDNDLARANALRAGFGLGLCQIGVARRDPNLVHLLPKALRIELPLWMVMHKDLKDTRRVRLLFDHLVEGLKDFAATSRYAAQRTRRRNPCASNANYAATRLRSTYCRMPPFL